MTSPTKFIKIIRNIFVVLLIYDYLSVVVCECYAGPISVPSCPGSAHEWSLKAREICNEEDKYHCLITENHNADKPDLIECCMPYKNISRGHRPRYNTVKKSIQEIACDHGYYMTKTFASNKYRLYGVEHCNDQKSACLMKGMKIYDNGSTTEDRKCYCDYKNNFEPDLPLEPNVVYFHQKDNYCIMSKCDLKFQEMNMIYQCVNVCKDGEYRPEKSMDCIPKSSTTKPPVVVPIDGSTAGVVIKTTLQTTTKSTPEDTIEQTVKPDNRITITAAVLSGVGIFAIICYIVKKCKDRNCCVYDSTRNIINAKNIVIGNESILQVNEPPLNPERIPLIEVVVSAPGQPINIKAKVLQHNRIEVSWQPPTDSANNIRSYNVYFNNSSVMEHPNNNYVLEDLIPDTVYHIQVSATSNGGEGEKSPMIDIKTPPLVPVLKLKRHAFTVNEGGSVPIECKTIIYEKNYHPPFWERIHENDETNKLTIREDKEGKFGLKRDPPCLTILNAEMSDSGDYCCCIAYTTCKGEEIVRSKTAHLIVEKAVKSGDTLIEKLVKINVEKIDADTIYMGGDIAKLTVKNTSKNKKGSSSSSSSKNSSPSENASSSENEMSDNIDEMENGTQNSDGGDVDTNQEKKPKMKPVYATEQGGDENNINGNSINEDTENKMSNKKNEKETHNSDYGNEKGDVGVNTVEKSNMKPVSVTGKNNICKSAIERIAAKHGFSVKNVPADGNCMFHAIALQLLGNKLNNKIGEEKYKELRCKIVDFLKNNDTTPTGEKYSSFLSGVGENDREIKMKTYLASMKESGCYGDEIILRAVSHCFNVCIRVLSTASPEQFIDYKSPGISEDSSTVYLGFIDESLHYVRLQPKSSENHRPYTSMNESSV